MSNKPYLTEVLERIEGKEVIVDVASTYNYAAALDTFMRSYRGDSYVFLVIDMESRKEVERIEGYNNPYNIFLSPRQQERREEEKKSNDGR